MERGARGLRPQVRALLASGLAVGLCMAATGTTVLGQVASPQGAADQTQGSVETLVGVQYAPLVVSSVSLPPGARGIPYPPVALTATGGLAPYAWSLAAGALPAGVILQPDGVLTGLPTAAANPILTVRVQDAESPPQEATRVLALLVTAPGVRVTAASTATSSGGGAVLRIGGGSTPQTLAAATGGSGSVSLAEYSGDPAPAEPALASGGGYFDVALSPGSTFTRLTIARCGRHPGDVAFWWSVRDGHWLPVSDRSFDPASGCLSIVVTATTSPSLADLGGTYLTVGPASPTGPPQTVQASVGSGGGLLGTPDGSFRLAIPPGAIGGGELQVKESASPPSLPPNTVLASPLLVLVGQPLGQPLPAVLRYEASALRGLSPERLSVYVQSPPGGAWQAVPTAVDGVDGTVEAPLAGPGTIAVLADLRSFTDVPAGYWARGAIDALLADGAINGLPDGSFRPEAPVTRAEFVKLLDVVLGLPPDGGGFGGFADVPAHAWFRPWVDAAAAAGIAHGRSPTGFFPNRPITRQEMAVLVARGLQLAAGQSQGLPFADAATIAPWAVPAVGAASAAGYIAGFPDGTFRPDDAATRAQAATVLEFVLLHRSGARP